MKVIKSKKINAFGGLNFVHDYLEHLNIANNLNYYLPKLAPQSEYTWNDIFSTFLSIYYCGGTCIEDSKTILSHHFGENPFFKLCSPDTIERRLKQLAAPLSTCFTPRGIVEHEFCHNEMLTNLNIANLKSLGVFAEDVLVLDYDNTIVFTEKSDSKMTYKKQAGYQPGVCLINEKHVAFVENRNGNSSAKSFQDKTLQRMFDSLEQQDVSAKYIFRADSASHQYSVFQTLIKNKCLFFIGAKNSYVESYYSTVKQWYPAKQGAENIEIGETIYTPYKKRYTNGGIPISYRLLVKRKPNRTGQINAITGDAYQYRAIITNDFEKDLHESVEFYNQRGGAEKQFDILKNDFGWSSLPFSSLAENGVFMYFAAICRNLFITVIQEFAQRYKNITSTSRMKRFIFAFITKPARWVKTARQWCLRVYGEIHLNI